MRPISMYDAAGKARPIPYGSCIIPGMISIAPARISPTIIRISITPLFFLNRVYIAKIIEPEKITGRNHKWQLSGDIIFISHGYSRTPLRADSITILPRPPITGTL